MDSLSQEELLSFYQSRCEALAAERQDWIAKLRGCEQQPGQVADLHAQLDSRQNEVLQLQSGLSQANDLIWKERQVVGAEIFMTIAAV